MNDEKLPEVFESTKLSCEVDVDNLRGLQKDLGELGHKKKSATKPEEIDQLLEKYNVKEQTSSCKSSFFFRFSAREETSKETIPKGC